MSTPQISDEWMAEPITQWEPALLRKIGITICITAVMILGTHHIPNLKKKPRLRFLLTVTFVTTAIGGMNQYSIVIEALTIAVAVAAVVIPLSVCVQAYKVIISTD